MTPKHTNSRNADKFVVRLPDGLRGRIGEVASTARRSMNSEIVARLIQSLDADVGTLQSGAVTVFLSDVITKDIAGQAQLSERSVNSEIIYRLKRSIVVDQLQDEQSRMIGILQRRIEELETQLQLEGVA